MEPDIRGERQDPREGIEICLDCERACLTSVAHWLGKGGAQADARRHILLLQDCAEISRTAAGFLIRRSDLRAWTCLACAIVAERCAADCELTSDDMQPDPVLASCADVCRRCAEWCRQVSANLLEGSPEAVLSEELPVR